MALVSHIVRLTGAERREHSGRYACDSTQCDANLKGRRVISVSRSAAKDARYHTKFSVYRPATLDDLATTVCTEIWSPIQWTEGLRAKGSFEKALLVALDFDDGHFTLDDAKELVTDYELSHVIATTKSHRLPKISPSGHAEAACDRFRLIFVGDAWCGDREQYEYNMKELTALYGADKSCKDSARFFWPCKEIVSVGRGNKFHWQPLPEGYERDEVARRRQRARLQAYPKGIYPNWLRDILVHGVPVGERHVTSYKLGATMSMMSYTEDEIVALILKTSIGEIGEAEVRRAVQNGIRAQGSET